MTIAAGLPRSFGQTGVFVCSTPAGAPPRAEGLVASLSLTNWQSLADLRRLSPPLTSSAAIMHQASCHTASGQRQK